VAYPSGRVGAAFVSNQMSLLYSEWEPNSTEVETVTIESNVPALPMSLGIRAFTNDQPSIAYFSQVITGDPEHSQSLYRLRVAAPGESTKRHPTLSDRPWDALELAQYSIANGPAVEGSAAAYNRLSRSGVIGTNRTDRGPAYAWTDPVSGEIQVAQMRGYDDLLSRTAWMLYSTGVAGVPRTFHEQQPGYDHYVNPLAPTQPILTMGVESLDQHAVRWMASTSTIPGGPDDWNIHVVDAYGSRPGEVVEISRSSGSITGMAQLYYTAGDELRRATTFGDLPTAANEWQVLGIPWHQSSQIAKASFWHQGVLAAEEDGLVQYRW
jgi:hypothetical protein